MSTTASSGTVALVTGAAIRLGRVIALALARAGADVAVHFRSSREEAQRVVGEIQGLGRRAEALTNINRLLMLDTLIG